jgi:hypothetical protein
VSKTNHTPVWQVEAAVEGGEGGPSDGTLSGPQTLRECLHGVLYKVEDLHKLLARRVPDKPGKDAAKVCHDGRTRLCAIALPVRGIPAL